MMSAALIHSIASDESLVLDFFVSFSRFECALKRGGYVREGSSGAAAPDWTAFGEAIDARLSAHNDPAYAEAKAFLLTSPPQKQVFVRPNSMVWEVNARRLNESESLYLLRLVRDVRNNLFHGGKFPAESGAPQDGETLRNARLLGAGLTVLGACLLFNTRVQVCYEEAR